jgi:hypothetical protein
MANKLAPQFEELAGSVCSISHGERVTRRGQRGTSLRLLHELRMKMFLAVFACSFLGETAANFQEKVPEMAQEVIFDLAFLRRCRHS